MAAEAGLGTSGQVLSGRGLVRRVLAWRGVAVEVRRVMSWPGLAWPVEARWGMSGRGGARQPWRGESWYGEFWSGRVRRVVARQPRLGVSVRVEACPGTSRRGMAGMSWSGQSGPVGARSGRAVEVGHVGDRRGQSWRGKAGAA